MNASPDAAPLTSRFRFLNPALFFPRARLDAAGLLLTGWHWRGRYNRRLPLDRILQADALDDNGLLLWLTNGETIRLRIDRAHQWKERISVLQDRSLNAAP